MFTGLQMSRTCALAGNNCVLATRFLLNFHQREHAYHTQTGFEAAKDTTATQVLNRISQLFAVPKTCSKCAGPTNTVQPAIGHNQCICCLSSLAR
jgi:hypothetical protein